MATTATAIIPSDPARVKKNLPPLPRIPVERMEDAPDWYKRKYTPKTVTFALPSALDRLYELHRLKKIGWQTLGIGVAVSTFINRKGNCFPSRQAIANLCGCHPQRISEALAILERVGFLKRTFRFGKSSIYTLTQNREDPLPKTGKTTLTQNADTEVRCLKELRSKCVTQDTTQSLRSQEEELQKEEEEKMSSSCKDFRNDSSDRNGLQDRDHAAENPNIQKFLDEFNKHRMEYRDQVPETLTPKLKKRLLPVLKELDSNGVPYSCLVKWFFVDLVEGRDRNPDIWLCIDPHVLAEWRSEYKEEIGEYRRTKEREDFTKRLKERIKAIPTDWADPVNELIREYEAKDYEGAIYWLGEQLAKVEAAIKEGKTPPQKTP